MKPVIIFTAWLLMAFAAFAGEPEPTAAQKKFVELMDSYADQYAAAPNQLKKSALVPQREREMRDILKKYLKPGEYWYGTLDRMNTTSEGNAAIEIKLLGSNSVRFRTNQTEFADKNTLIPHGSILYKKISDMQEKDMVRFTGSLGPEESLTEHGKMTEPEFLFRFKDIQKVE